MFYQDLKCCCGTAECGQGGGNVNVAALLTPLQTPGLMCSDLIEGCAELITLAAGRSPPPKLSSSPKTTSQPFQFHYFPKPHYTANAQRA